MTAARFERFAPGVFDTQVGQPISVITIAAKTQQGTLVAAEVRDNGREVLLTVEVPEGVVPVALSGGLSLTPQAQ